MWRLGLFLLLGVMGTSLHAAPVRLSDAIAQFETMRTDEALKSFNKLQARDPANAQVAYYLGRIFLRKYQHELAAEWLRKAIEMDGRSAQYRVSLCEALGRTVDRANIFDQIGIAMEVYDQLLRAAELEPNNPLPHDALMQYYMEAPSIAGGSSRKARERAAIMLRLNPGLGHRAMGDIARYEKRYEEAEREYKTAIRLLPDDPLPSYQLLELYRQQERYDAMRTVLKTIVERFPGESAVHYHQAEILILNKQFNEQVVRLLETYIKLGPRRDEDPTPYQAYLELGHVHQRLKNWFSARRAYQQAKDLNPNDEQIQAALRALD